VKHTVAIAGRDVRSMFSTPVAYVMLASYLVILGYVFFVGLGIMLQQVQQIEALQMFDLLEQFNLNQRVIAPAFGTSSVVLVFIIPLITMGLFAQERQQGTLELLLTSPLTIWEIVLGKYLGALAFVVLVVLLSAVYPLLLFLYGDPELSQIAANLLGLFLLGAALTALGCFVSALTSSQVVAAVLGIAGGLFLYLIGIAGQLAPEGVARSVLQYIAIGSHFDASLDGLVQLQDVVYFIVFVGLFLTLVRAVIESLRWR
jgi:ABC-2 type transport system permease protein